MQSVSLRQYDRALISNLNTAWGHTATNANQPALMPDRPFVLRTAPAGRRHCCECQDGRLAGPAGGGAATQSARRQYHAPTASPADWVRRRPGGHPILATGDGYRMMEVWSSGRRPPHRCIGTGAAAIIARGRQQKRPTRLMPGLVPPTAGSSQNLACSTSASLAVILPSGCSNTGRLSLRLPFDSNLQSLFVGVRKKPTQASAMAGSPVESPPKSLQRLTLHERALLQVQLEDSRQARRGAKSCLK